MFIRIKKSLDKKAGIYIDVHRVYIQEVIMDSVKVNDNGQITIPNSITKSLGITKGEEFRFIKKNKYFIMVPSDYDPLTEIQNIMDGEAEKVGWKTEDDVIDFMRELRKERYLENANNG